MIASLAELGCRRISLMGGEPLLYPRWSELVRAARDRAMLVDMISCGQGIDATVADPRQLAGMCADCEHGKRCRRGCTATAYAMHGRPGMSSHCFHRGAAAT